jgi:zinc protease
VTLEALALIKEIVENFGPSFDDQDLEATQSFLLRTNARAFETLGAKLGILGDMSSLGFASDYVLEREEQVRQFDVDEARRLAAEYLDPEQMVWVVVGDAATQRPRLDALGLGPSILLDREGRRVEGG